VATTYIVLQFRVLTVSKRHVFHECFHRHSFKPVNCNEYSLCRPPSCSLLPRHLSAVCDWTIPYAHLSEDARPHLCSFAAQRPWPVEMVQYTPRTMRSKPGCRIVGSVTSDWLTTVADPEESARCLICIRWCYVSALTLLVGRQEGHPAFK